MTSIEQELDKLLVGKLVRIGSEPKWNTVMSVDKWSVPTGSLRLRCLGGEIREVAFDDGIEIESYEEELTKKQIRAWTNFELLGGQDETISGG